MSQAVWLFWWAHPSAFRADCEDVSGGALVPAPLRGAARGGCTGPFAASLWGCLRRFGCFEGGKLAVFRADSEDVSGGASFPSFRSLPSLTSLPSPPSLPCLPCLPGFPSLPSPASLPSLLSPPS